MNEVRRMSVKKEEESVLPFTIIARALLVLPIIISANMPQHEECNLFLEDFSGEALYENCRACKILGGDEWNCIGASHKRKDTGKLIILLTPANLTSLL